MPQLNDQEAQAWFGGNRPSNQQVIDDAQRYSKDPFALWWDTFITGRGTPSQVLGASGGGAKPIRTPEEAAALAGSLQLNGDVRNAQQLDAMARAGVAMPNRQNPYNAGIADQSRAAQLALIQQMRAQQAGPSLAGLQGQRGMAQAGQQALMQGGRAGMLGAQGASTGMAGDMGQARLAEIMRSQAGMGGVAGNLRGGDLRSAEAQSQAALAQQRQDEARRQMYAKLGLNLQNTRDQTAANRDITRLQLLGRRRAQDMKLVNDTVQSGAGVFGGAI